MHNPNKTLITRRSPLSKRTWLYIAVGLVIVVGVGLIIFFLNRDRRTETEILADTAIESYLANPGVSNYYSDSVEAYFEGTNLPLPDALSALSSYIPLLDNAPLIKLSRSLVIPEELFTTDLLSRENQVILQKSDQSIADIFQTAQARLKTIGWSLTDESLNANFGQIEATLAQLAGDLTLTIYYNPVQESNLYQIVLSFPDFSLYNAPPFEAQSLETTP